MGLWYHGVWCWNRRKHWPCFNSSDALEERAAGLLSWKHSYFGGLKAGSKQRLRGGKKPQGTGCTRRRDFSQHDKICKCQNQQWVLQGVWAGGPLGLEIDAVPHAGDGWEHSASPLGHTNACSSSWPHFSSSHTLEVLLPKGLPGVEMIHAGWWLFFTPLLLFR